MFLKRPRRRRKLRARSWARCSRNWPGAACAPPRKAPARAGYRCSKSSRTRTSFRVRAQRSCSRRTRLEGGAAGYERPARAGLAQSSAPCPGAQLVCRPGEEGLGHLRGHPAWFHPPFVQSRLHRQCGFAAGGRRAVATMDATEGTSLLDLARRGRFHDLRPRHRASTSQ